MDIAEQIKSINERLAKLEKTVFDSGPTSLLKKENFSGPRGGILMLLSEGFFDVKRSVDEVYDELIKRNYHYIKQVVHTALKRFSLQKGPLVVLSEAGKKVYVKRK